MRFARAWPELRLRERERERDRRTSQIYGVIQLSAQALLSEALVSEVFQATAVKGAFFKWVPRVPLRRISVKPAAVDWEAVALASLFSASVAGAWVNLASVHLASVADASVHQASARAARVNPASVGWPSMKSALVPDGTVSQQIWLRGVASAATAPVDFGSVELASIKPASRGIRSLRRRSIWLRSLELPLASGQSPIVGWTSFEGASARAASVNPASVGLVAACQDSALAAFGPSGCGRFPWPLVNFSAQR